MFKLIDHKLTLVEIAPGLDLEKDVLSCLDFRPKIADDLKIMEPGIFNEKWGELEKFMS